MKSINQFLVLWLLLLFCACETDSENERPSPDNPKTLVSVQLSTDKSAYRPSEEVTVSVSGRLPGNCRVRCRHLNNILADQEFSGSEWQWTLPPDEGKAYLIDFYKRKNGEETTLASIAVDANSDWTSRPRYGFLSRYDSRLSQEEIDCTLDFLKRLHINGLQYYDWHFKHHKPLKMIGKEPAESWQELSKREVSFEVVKTYIQKARALGIASMSYNLLFGVWEDYALDGVKKEWLLFSDAHQGSVSKHDLDDNWAQSDILLTDPSNKFWQDYIFTETEAIYKHLNFDGWHLDQLGDRGSVYNFLGKNIYLPLGYESFLKRLRNRFPSKKMVMNAVNQYGQKEIQSAPVDFAYTEVWEPNGSFKDLADIIKSNQTVSFGKKSVLAAYLNYNKADHQGTFNTPAVLLADAVIFAFGASHLEMGEHMLGKEYFPNQNLRMLQDLKDRLVEFYDFQVAYENLLQDEGEWNEATVEAQDLATTVQAWPPQKGAISTVCRKTGQSQVIHFLNFSEANHLSWRDADGTQSYPNKKKNIELAIDCKASVGKVWYASPDYQKGVAQELDYRIEDGKIVCTLPVLQFWGMLVIE